LNYARADGKGSLLGERSCAPLERLKEKKAKQSEDGKQSLGVLGTDLISKNEEDVFADA